MSPSDITHVRIHPNIEKFATAVQTLALHLSLFAAVIKTNHAAAPRDRRRHRKEQAIIRHRLRVTRRSTQYPTKGWTRK